MLLEYPSENSCLFHLFMNRQYQVWQWTSEPDSFKVLFIIIVVVVSHALSFFVSLHSCMSSIAMSYRRRTEEDLEETQGSNSGSWQHYALGNIAFSLAVVMLVFLSKELLILKDFQIVFDLLYILWAPQWYELNIFFFINITYITSISLLVWWFLLKMNLLLFWFLIKICLYVRKTYKTIIPLYIKFWFW